MNIYLYVAQHNQTGLKYFGKTTRGDPIKTGYSGSGKYWKNHLKKHGEDVSIEVIAEFDYSLVETASEFALQFSEDNNIVESKEWANLRPENAKDGALKGNIISEKCRNASSKNMKLNNPMSKLRTNNGSFKKGYSPLFTDERRKNHSIAKVGERNPNFGNSSAANRLNKDRFACPYCNKSTNLGNFKRWHGENCKMK